MYRTTDVFVFERNIYVSILPSIDICKHGKNPENASECICDASRPS
jgi:hypothetical protein